MPAMLHTNVLFTLCANVMYGLAATVSLKLTDPVLLQNPIPIEKGHFLHIRLTQKKNLLQNDDLGEQ